MAGRAGLVPGDLRRREARYLREQGPGPGAPGAGGARSARPCGRPIAPGGSRGRKRRFSCPCSASTWAPRAVPTGGRSGWPGPSGSGCGAWRRTWSGCCGSGPPRAGPWPAVCSIPSRLGSRWHWRRSQRVHRTRRPWRRARSWSSGCPRRWPRSVGHCARPCEGSSAGSRGRWPTDGEVFDAMVAEALRAWTAREPGARRPDPVIERDRFLCAVPGCGSRSGLHDHHVVFRSAGGSDEPQNRVTLCAFHHQRGLHAGRMRVRGRAPDGLVFELGLRPGLPPLARYRWGGCAAVRGVRTPDEDAAFRAWAPTPAPGSTRRRRPTGLPRSGGSAG